MKKLIKIITLFMVFSADFALAAAEPTAPEQVSVPSAEAPKEAYKVVSGAPAPPPIHSNDFAVDQRFALKGFSVGAIGYNQSFLIKAAALLDGVTSTTVTGHTADIQNVGILGRYSVIPIGGLGTDFGVAMAYSINHNAANYSALVTVKTEFNLGWGYMTTNGMPYYVLGGFGYENVRGDDIERVIASGGGCVQIGGGISYSKSLNFEGFYSMARHGVSSVYLDRVTAAAQAQGTTTVTYETEKTFVTSNILLGRMIYKF